MNTLIFAVAAIMCAAPHEFHIDCNGWNGVGTTKFTYVITAMDGTVYKNGLQLFPGSDPEDVRALMWLRLKPKGWNGREVGKGILVLEDYEKSPIKSVEFTSDGWKPDVRYVLKPPPEK